MDAVDSLPLELWLKIFDYLPIADVQRAMSVHRMFHEAGLAKTRRKLTLCNRGLVQHRRVKSILKQPVLGLQVWHAHILPGNPERGASREHLEEFALAPASLFSWSRVKQYIQEALLTHKRALDSAVQVVAHLPNVHHVTVDVLPSPAKFSSTQMTKLWSAICPANIKILDLVFKAPQLGFLARSIQSTSSVFDGIEELKLYQYGDPGQAATSSISADLGRIIDTTRGSLRSLFLHFKERVSPDSLGYIPNLSRLQIVISEEEQHQPYRNFLKLHKDTLKHLVLKPVSTSAVHTLWYEYDPEDCPRLETIEITFGKVMGRTSPPFPFPHFGPFADSLTTLSVHGTTLPYESVQKLVASLCDPDRGSLLQRLRVNVDRLSPELVDLLAQYLKSLKLLDLFFYDLTGNKERPRQGKRDFEKGMGSRKYPRWELRSLYLRRKDRKGIVENVRLMQDFAERIPSIEEFGPFDWSDVESSPNPVA